MPAFRFRPSDRFGPRVWKARGGSSAGTIFIAVSTGNERGNTYTHSEATYGLELDQIKKRPSRQRQQLALSFGDDIAAFGAGGALEKRGVISSYPPLAKKTLPWEGSLQLRHRYKKLCTLSPRNTLRTLKLSPRAQPSGVSGLDGTFPVSAQDDQRKVKEKHS